MAAEREQNWGLDLHALTRVGKSNGRKGAGVVDSELGGRDGPGCTEDKPVHLDTTGAHTRPMLKSVNFARGLHARQDDAYPERPVAVGCGACAIERVSDAKKGAILREHEVILRGQVRHLWTVGITREVNREIDQQRLRSDSEALETPSELTRRRKWEQVAAILALTVIVLSRWLINRVKSKEQADLHTRCDGKRRSTGQIKVCHVNVPKYDKRGRRIPREGNPVMVQIEGIACSHRKEGAALYEQARSHEGMAEHAIYAWAGRVPWVREADVPQRTSFRHIAQQEKKGLME
ncbi:hypothetical protein BGW80DRAFT_1254046 [Lactifluus volemus]|nr:hypothetical protein BGW80DRAFT_1254046 [Lactifluus volemus]